MNATGDFEQWVGHKHRAQRQELDHPFIFIPFRFYPSRFSCSIKSHLLHIVFIIVDHLRCRRSSSLMSVVFVVVVVVVVVRKSISPISSNPHPSGMNIGSDISLHQKRFPKRLRCRRLQCRKKEKGRRKSSSLALSSFPSCRHSRRMPVSQSITYLPLPLSLPHFHCVKPNTERVSKPETPAKSKPKSKRTVIS
jgi:hypothetical protein